MVVLGAAILWFGWFGFNAGSAGAANGQAVSAFVNTNTATATAALTWTLLSWWIGGKPSVVGAAAGAVAGLVAITPASGYVEPMESIAIGAGAGALCYFAVRLRARIGMDDSLDVIGVHGVGGAWGALATGVFAATTVSGLEAATGIKDFGNGLIHGNAMQVWNQAVGLFAVGIYSFVVTFVLLKVLDLTMGIRVSEEDEDLGLDVTQHGERAYTSDEGGVPLSPGPILPAPPVAYTASATPAPGSATWRRVT
jgi:Amt family ammonium transporter